MQLIVFFWLSASLAQASSPMPQAAMAWAQEDSSGVPADTSETRHDTSQAQPVSPGAHLDGHLWSWVETVDADQSVHRPDSTTAGHDLRFFADGRFVETYPRGCCDYAGHWRLTGDVLALDYSGDPRRSDKVRYQILDLSNEELVLGVRGRHGLVRERFVAK